MSIEWYRGDNAAGKNLKTPQLAWVMRGLCAVTQDGVVVAWLISPIGEMGIMESNIGARGKLETAGYRTDWADWTEEGHIIRLLEDIV